MYSKAHTNFKAVPGVPYDMYNRITIIKVNTFDKGNGNCEFHLFVFYSVSMATNNDICVFSYQYVRCITILMCWLMLWPHCNTVASSDRCFDLFTYLFTV